MSARSYPTQPDELTTAWLTGILRTTGVLDDHTSVISFSTDPVGEGIGMLGVLVRVHLSFDGPAPDAPTSVIAKFPTLVAGNRAVAMHFRLYEREIRFYLDIEPQVEVSAPRCYGGEIDPVSGDAVLVLEDLGDYAVGDQVVGCTADEAITILDAVVGLHARFWDRTTGDPLLASVPAVDDDFQIDGIAGGTAAGWDPCMAMFAAVIPDEIKAARDRFIPAVPELHRRMGKRRQTVIHGDVRLDNMMFATHPGQRSVVLLDWSLVTTCGLHDVAYLVTQNVTTDERRAHEPRIIEHYHRRLGELGVRDYTLEQCWDDYRLSALHMYAYAIVIAGTLDPSNERGAAFMRELVSRASAAVMDHDLLSLLP
jgi:Ecdysteroid kinase-like family